MVKKLLAILLIFSFAVAMVPQEAFCDEHCEQTESTAAHQHCSVSCHVSCHSAVIPVEFLLIEHPVVVSSIHLSKEVSYQNPIITRLKRPPIQIS